MEIKKSGRGENRNSFNLTNVYLHCIQKSFNRMPQLKKNKSFKSKTGTVSLITQLVMPATYLYLS